MLRCIAYCSRMSAPLSDEELLQMTRTSMANNDAASVSGILFCMNDRFIQVIEGEGDVVGALYDRIAADPRHQDVIKVLDGPLEARAFDRWSMRLVGEDDLSPSEQAIIIQALRSVEPQTAEAARRPTLGALLAGPLRHIVAPAFHIAPGDAETMETADRLLHAAEDILADICPDCALLTLKLIAREAGVDEAVARSCFRDVDELIHAGAIRALAIEHLSFIDMMVGRRFESRADIALAMVAFVAVSNAERDGLPACIGNLIREHSFDVTRDSARTIAELIHAATPREGWPCPELVSSEIAVALRATAAAASALMDYDGAALGRPRNQAWLSRISLAALGD